MKHEFLKLIENSVKFSYVRGGIATLGAPSDKGWKSRPENLISHLAKGQSKLYFKESGKTYQVNSGDTVFIPSGVVRRSELFPRNRKNTYFWAHVHFTFLSNIDLLRFFRNPFIISGGKSTELGEINSNLAILNEKPFGMEELCQRKILGFKMLRILLGISDFTPDFDEWQQDFSRLSGVIEYMNNHIETKSSLKEFAAKANLSESRFHRLFKNVMNQTPIEYVREKKMMKAQEKLLMTDSSIFEIAETLGYQDQFIFSKSFKRHFGTSPLQYRQQMIGDNDAV